MNKEIVSTLQITIRKTVTDTDKFTINLLKSLVEQGLQNAGFFVAEIVVSHIYNPVNNTIN